MNEKYAVKVESPLLKQGLSISTEVSKEYIKEAQETLMNSVRVINETKSNDIIRLELVIEAQKQQQRRLEITISQLEDKLHEALKVPEIISKQDKEEAQLISDLASEPDANYEREDEITNGDKDE